MRSLELGGLVGFLGALQLAVQQVAGALPWCSVHGQGPAPPPAAWVPAAALTEGWRKGQVTRVS